MRIPRSNRFILNPGDKNTLDRMARSGGGRVKGMDKGDASDGDSSASLEEITAEEFRPDSRSSRSRVWDDGRMGYSVASSFSPNLYSFAWAQAVQNKPLGLEMKLVEDTVGETGKDGDDVVILDGSEDSPGQMEKEEGELEEGEIDLDSDSVVEETIHLSSDKAEDESKPKDLQTKESEEDKEEVDVEDFDKRVAEILEELDTITSEEAEASLEGVCSRLLKSFAGLKTMFSESHVPILDALVQQAFMGIQTLHSVFCSWDVMKTKQNTDLLLRLLIHIKNQYSALLTQEQVTEIDSMARLLVSNDVAEEKVTQNESFGTERTAVSYFSSPEKPYLNSKDTYLRGLPSEGTYLPKLELLYVKSRVEFSPLLDLHADYEEGSLPSPTRENPPSFLLPKPIGFGGFAISQPTVIKTEIDSANLPSYMSDALKAVSSYQKKYGQNSILPSNQLPSPTPSEEFNCEEEKNDEVSSSVVARAYSVKPAGSGSSFPPTDFLSTLHSTPNNMVGQLNTQSNQAVKAKSRDPRLRFINQNVGVSSDKSAFMNGYVEGETNCKKQKAADASMLEIHSLKRQRHSSMSPTDVPLNISSVISETTKYTEFGTKKPENGVTSADSRLENNGDSINANIGNEQNSAVTSAPPVTLPSVLKEMDINPAILMELIKMKQKTLAAESRQKFGASVEATVQINDATLKPVEVGQNPSSKPQIPAQKASSLNDAGRIQMKPRDPRRILRESVVRKSESLAIKQNKMGLIPLISPINKDRLIDRDPVEQAQPLNVSWQLTKNLKNSAETMPFSKQTSASTSFLSDDSQPIPNRLVTESYDSIVLNTSSSQSSTRDVSQTTNPWGDVDHLLDGYDDSQKVAIQKERSRRIAEQNKMFAARKLCLVLDLDHTLLNSAKFVEVEPVHEEMLRKKEEQDREQPQRHLFRFQHMAMWTKLRPGVWNFLEKASKIFELHLYTMGNKLYATEMAKVLDPTGTLFSGRVISRGDDGEPCDGDDRVPKSKDLEGVLGMESAVVIIDDSVRVWPHNRHNLILVERYTYFPCSRRQFGLLGPSLLEIDHDERPEDGTLASCLSVIEKIHQIFFSHSFLNDVDVRHILATEQRKILAGCKIVFSRIFPVGEANPHLHPLWQTAEQFGAVCTNQIDEQVTHVVANSLGTDKVNWALSTGRAVVHPGWVEASALLYRRAVENDFAVKL
ncbi:RNA polymerase II C-terminal domain phosphatase-like 3 [Platanthera zijinensis]|uniref:protein-serine/threonine phosphatase n=1 Tax=Platanthera zijinensis TaxID=2320716 RepID=A0AAP0FYH3_9ASPA